MEKLKLKATSFEWFRETNTHIAPLSLYYGCFEKIASSKSIGNVDITTLRKWILSELKNDILTQYYTQRYIAEKKKNGYYIHFFILKNNIMIYLHNSLVEFFLALIWKLRQNSFKTKCWFFRKRRIKQQK